MNDIKFTSLDSAYDSCSQMYDAIKGSGKLARDDLSTAIGNLRNNWIGSDATIHLNNLRGVYNQLDNVIVGASMIAEAVSDAIVSTQEVRQANGGSGNVGTRFTKLESGGVIAEIPDTSEYKCNSAAENDKTTLESAKTQYETFQTSFTTTMESLLANWEEGVGREKAVSLKDEFSTAVDSNKKQISDALDNLTIALDNIKKLGA